MPPSLPLLWYRGASLLHMDASRCQFTFTALSQIPAVLAGFLLFNPFGRFPCPRLCQYGGQHRSKYGRSVHSPLLTTVLKTRRRRCKASNGTLRVCRTIPRCNGYPIVDRKATGVCGIAFQRKVAVWYVLKSNVGDICGNRTWSTIGPRAAFCYCGDWFGTRRYY